MDYQQRALEFAVDDLVYPIAIGKSDIVGRVVALYPAIGMADVEWPHGPERVPVEDLIRSSTDGDEPPSAGHDNIPGGAGVVPVSSGPYHTAGNARRVAEAFVKRALYWAAPDRHYRASQPEVESGDFRCPKCGDGSLRYATYKRESGQNIRLMACPECLFLIKSCDILGHPDYVDDFVDDSVSVESGA